MQKLAISALTLFLIIACTSSSGKPQMFRVDATHSGVYKSTFSGQPKEFAWSFKTSGAVRSTPLYDKGRVFFGSADNNFYAVDSKSGRLIWKVKTGGPENSSAAIDEKGNLFFLSADNNLYSVNSINGSVNWKFSTGKDLPYRWGFDYLLSSPTLSDHSLYFGSGDGNLYALNKNNGSLRWKFDTQNRIRSSPAIYNNLVMFGDMGGHFYALNTQDGHLLWNYDTKGAASKNNLGEEAFDRSAIISSPAVEDSIICFGGRDGFLYALNIKTGVEIWVVNHDVSWAISTPVLFNGVVYTGTSDGHFIQAVDLHSGKEIWRCDTKGLVWSSAAISNNRVYVGDGLGNFYEIDLKNGKLNWTFKFNGWVLSSPILFDDMLCFGCDNGYLYAMRGTGHAKKGELQKTVFWENTSGYKWFKFGIDQTIKDYFVSQGYELLDSKKLKDFCEQRINDKIPGVVIFASNKIPYSVVPDSSGNNLFIHYLAAGGKAIVLGTNPLAYIRDHKTDRVVAMDFSVASKILGIHFQGIVTDALRGSYDSFPTTKGRKLGLDNWWVGFGGVDPKEVTTVLALNEEGNATAWIKNYGGPAGSGFIQLRLSNIVPQDLTFIQQIAEFSN